MASHRSRRSRQRRRVWPYRLGTWRRPMKFPPGWGWPSGAPGRSPGAAGAVHLAIAVPGLGEAGAGRSLVALANGLAQRGWRVDLVLGRSRRPPDNPEARHSAIAAAVRVVDLADVPGPWGLALGRYLRREQPATLLAAAPGVAIAAIVAKHLAQVATRVVILERYPPSKALLHGQPWRRRAQIWGMRLAYPWADTLLAASAGVADDLARVGRLPRSTIVPIAPIPLPAHLPTVHGSPPTHPWLQKPPIPVILAVGRLVPQKDFATFLRAIAQVRARHPLRAVILGEGPERLALGQLADDLGIGAAVDFPGFVPDAIACMGQATALVLSSRWEGCPAVVIEAMAVGTPVVATNCPHGPADLLANGRYGHLVPVGDETALAAAIERVLGGDRRLPPPQWLKPFEAQILLDRHETLLGLNDLRQPLARRLGAVADGPWGGDRSRLGTMGTNLGTNLGHNLGTHGLS
jgi:glycosyltransferase involved in cell wall biosynthesis